MNNYLKVWKRSFDFKGRAQRKEFWLFVLFNFIVMGILGGIDQETGFMIRPSKTGDEVGGLSFIFFCITILPTLSAGVRRLHDCGKSGWWLFVFFIPLVGFFWLPVILATDGTPRETHYGFDPKGRQAAIPITQPVLPKKWIYRISIVCLITGIVMCVSFVLITQTNIVQRINSNGVTETIDSNGNFTGIIDDVNSNNLSQEYLQKRINESKNEQYIPPDKYIALVIIGGSLIVIWIVLLLIYNEKKRVYNSKKTNSGIAGHT